MVSTIKFSEFVASGEPELNDITVGLKSGVNTKFTVQWTFYPPGPTDERPDLPTNGILRYNTDINLYEYYDGTTWVQLENNSTGGTVLPGEQYELAYYPGDGNFVVGLSTAPNGILKTDGDSFPSISQTLPSQVQNNITFLGTILSGIWQGTDIGLAYGGTGASLTPSNGGIFYSNADSAAILPGVANTGKMLRSNINSAPAWSTSIYSDTYTINSILYADNTNSVAGLPSVIRSSLTTNSTGVPTWIPLTNGQLVIGSTSGSPSAASLTAGSGITITPGSNSITISNSSPFIDFAINNLVYVANNGSNVTGTGSINNPYQSIVYAVSQISDASFSKPYTLMYSGVFNEVGTDFIIKPYVSYFGYGMNNSIINLTGGGSPTLSSTFDNVTSTVSFNNTQITNDSGSYALDINTTTMGSGTQLIINYTNCLITKDIRIQKGSGHLVRIYGENNCSFTNFNLSGGEIYLKNSSFSDVIGVGSTPGLAISFLGDDCRGSSIDFTGTGVSSASISYKNCYVATTTMSGDAVLTTDPMSAATSVITGGSIVYNPLIADFRTTIQAAKSGNNTDITALSGLTGDISNPASIRMGSNGEFQTGMLNADRIVMQAYDVDGTAYFNFITLTAGNTPTCNLSSAVTKDNRSFNFGGDFLMSGAFNFTGTLTGNTAVTFPTSGTLATTTGSISNADNIGITNDTTTNATMFPLWVTANTGYLPAKVTSTKLSFNPSTGTLTSTNFSGVWAGSIIDLAHGGTNANLTAANGAIPYSTASALALLSPGISGQLLQSGGSGAPSWTSSASTAGTILRTNGTSWIASTSTFADTYAVNTILYAASANTISGLATANNGVLITSAGGVPSIGSTLPSAVQGNITSTGTVTSGTWSSAVTGATITTSTLGNADSTQAAARFTTPVATTITASTTLGISHWGKLVIFNSASAITITLPQQSTTATVAGVQCWFENIGAGDVTFVKEGSETLTGNSLCAQNGTGKIFRDTTTDWMISGGTSILNGQYTIFVQTVGNNAYNFVRIDSPITVTQMSSICRSGTCTATLSIGGVTVTGTANSVSSSNQTQAITGNNTGVSGNYVTATISANSSCLDMSLTVSFTFRVNI